MSSSQLGARSIEVTGRSYRLPSHPSWLSALMAVARLSWANRLPWADAVDEADAGERHGHRC